MSLVGVRALVKGLLTRHRRLLNRAIVVDDDVVMDVKLIMDVYNVYLKAPLRSATLLIAAPFVSVPSDTNTHHLGCRKEVLGQGRRPLKVELGVDHGLGVIRVFIAYILSCSVSGDSRGHLSLRHLIHVVVGGPERAILHPCRVLHLLIELLLLLLLHLLQQSLLDVGVL